jgi:cytochrome c oxidase subunit IV
VDENDPYLYFTYANLRVLSDFFGVACSLGSIWSLITLTMSETAGYNFSIPMHRSLSNKI